MGVVVHQNALEIDSSLYYTYELESSSSIPVKYTTLFTVFRLQGFTNLLFGDKIETAHYKIVDTLVVR